MSEFSKLKKPSLPVAITMGVIIALLFSFLSINNTLVSYTESIDASWAQVENQLQRRSDLIPNLVNTVKGYAKQESTIFENIANARAKLAGAKTQGDKITAANEFQSSLSRLLVVVENYPNLKSNTQFQQLMDELAGSENRISVERKRYNEDVKLYNVYIKKFPAIVVAKIRNFEKRNYFEVSKEAQKRPEVQF